MYCPKCGTYNEDSYCFCLSCGTRLEELPSTTLDRKTSDGRYIIDPGEWSVSSDVEKHVVNGPVRNEVHIPSDILDKISEQADESDDKDLSQRRQSEDVYRRDNPIEEDVVVLRKVVAKDSVVTAARIPSSAETPSVLPRGFRILLACCAVLVLWIILTAVIIPGLNLRKQGAIIQAVVMCGALAVIKASWKSIVGDKPKSDKKEG